MFHPPRRIGRFRRWSLPLFFSAVLLLPARAEISETVGLDLERTIPLLGAPVLSADGTIWIIAPDGSLRYGPSPIPAEGTPLSSRGWSSVPPPAGHRLRRVAIGPDGAIWATAEPRGKRAVSVVRLERRGGAERWVFEDLPLVGFAFDLAVGPSGDVWVAGEWRDLFRRVEGRWEKIVIPVPYHVDRVIPNDDGSVWILASTRGLGAVLHWQPEKVRVRYRGSEMITKLVARSDRTISVALRNSILRIHAEDGKAAEAVSPLPGFEDGVAGHDDSGSGWVARGATLERYVGGTKQWSRILPFRVTAIEDLGAHGVYVADPELDLWRVRVLSAVSFDTQVGLAGFERVEPTAWRHGESLLVGIAPLQLANKRVFYVVDSHGANLVVGLDDLASPPPDPASSWRTAASRIGIEGPRWNAHWHPAYDSGALAADLNGDGHQDLILFTMYEGIRGFRNMGNDRFVDWTRESAIQSEPEDDAMGGCLLDADGDGDLDLYLANLLVGDRLFRNNGAAVFEEITVAGGINTRDGSHSATCIDLDDDGDTDIAVATWGRGLVLHENLGMQAGTPRFRTHRLLADRRDLDGSETLSTLNVNSAEAADLDRDGLPELFASVEPGSSILLRNRGGMLFDPDPLVFHGAPHDRIVGAAFADVDHDGDLDLLTTGGGEARLWRFDGDRFRRHQAEMMLGREGGERPDSRPLVTGDFDNDGDLDVLWGKLSGPVVFDRNRVDDGRSIVMRFVGPPANPAAIGAVIDVYPEGRSEDPSTRIARRFLESRSGPRSFAPGEVHIGGIPPGIRVDVFIRLPDGTSRLVTGVRTPFHGTLEVVPSRVATVFGRVSSGFHRLVGDPWTVPWAALTGFVTLLLGTGVFMLYRRARPGLGAWCAVLAGPLVSSFAYVLFPLDPGYPSVLAASAAGFVGAGTILAFVRSLMTSPPAPELLSELNVSLRTFRHNQTPQRIFSRLQFDLENLGASELSAGSPKFAILREDLRAYREVVTPELTAVVHLAGAAGLPVADGAAALTTQARLLPSLLTQLDSAPPGAALATRPFAELRKSMAEAAEWVDRARALTDRMLAVDVARVVGEWVASRRDTLPVPLSFIAAESGLLHARFLEADLRRVLDVLLENSTRAVSKTPNGRIEVRLERDGIRNLTLVFSDNGPGIPKANRDAIFRLGFSNAPGGEGYGLYYARRTVQRYGGTLSMRESSDGRTVFVISLDRIPAVQGESAA